MPVFTRQNLPINNKFETFLTTLLCNKLSQKQNFCVRLVRITVKIERLVTDQKVRGSSPFGRTIFSAGVSAPAVFLFSNCERTAFQIRATVWHEFKNA